MEESKALIRRRILDARDNLTESERRRAAVLLTERILGHQWYYLAENILAFVSFGSEIDTSEILKDALQKGKKVYVPKVVGVDMEFYRIDHLDMLEKGYKGILEPSGKEERFCYEEEVAKKTLMIMPGVAFDFERNRIGYGKGFYDRYLADKAALQMKTIAVGYQCQMTEHIPSEGNDIKPCQIICI